MNKKGQGIGGFLMIFVVVVVGLALFLAVAQIVGPATTIITNANETVTVANGTAIDLTGQEFEAIIWVGNSTDGYTIGAGNYTMSEGVSTVTGVKTVQVTFAADNAYVGETFNMSYTYGPDGYIDNSGARSVAALIAIFMALGIAAVVLIPSLRDAVASGLMKG